MKIISWNVCGFGNKDARNHLNMLIKTQNPDIIFLCETKNQSKRMSYLLKRFKYPNITLLDSIGLSGGLCILWKDGIDLQIIDAQMNMINCTVKLDSQNNSSMLTCIYGALNPSDKENQWNHLRNLRTTYTNPWIVIGDLNFILHQNEKEGGNPHGQSDIDANNLLLDSNNLFSMPYIGNPFTWTNRRNDNNLILERLDGAVISYDKFNIYPNVVLYHLTVLGSDHCPIMLITSKLECNTEKPFRVNRSWFRDPTCSELIEAEWKGNTNGSASFILANCLHNTKYCLKNWNYQHFGNINSQISNLEFQLSNLTRTVSNHNDIRVVELTRKLKYWYDVEEDFWRQRGIWLDDRHDIETELLRHFSDMSRTTHPPSSDTYLDRLENIITDQDNLMLTEIPSSEEIKKIVFDMKPWTTPGPDGFPPGFYQLMLETVGPEVVKMVKSFFHSKYILKQLNHNFTILIPKSNCPRNAADFRPISLCNVSYKIISKLLVSRLKKVLNKIISPSQTAFISGRLIHDNIVISHEFIHSMKKTKDKDGCVAIKLDMSKALKELSGPSSLIVSKSKVYYPQRGLRQGDPLSPHLFILCMEALSRILIQVEHDKLIHGFKANKHCPSISHLFYADDCLIFIKARIRDARNLTSIIDQFSKFSGQAVNFEKSALAFSKKVPNNVKNEISNILRIRRMSLNEKYLGVPLLLQKIKFDSFKHLIDNSKGRLAHWKPTYLAPPGRTVMNQSVLGSLASHHLGVFPMPKELTDKLDSIQMRFWWGKKDGEKDCFPKGWIDIALPKELGGLNIRQTDILNLTLLAKLAWRMVENPDDKWSCILRGKYFMNANPLCDSVPKQGSWIWKGICTGLDIIKKNYVWEIGNGKSIHIWKDNWIPNMHRPPSTQLIDHDMKCWKLETINALFDRNTVSEILKIRIPFNGEDKLRWEPTSNGSFTVKSAYKVILNDRLLHKSSKNNMSINCSFQQVTPLQAEAHALLNAVLWAKGKGWTKVHLEGDSLNVINAVNGSHSAVKWTTQNLINDVVDILNSFSVWLCTHVHMDANHLADILAKFARSKSVCFQYFSDTPEWIQTLIQQDKTLV
ncbi:uncharacterized protein LOC113305796 [Papaver somniferum]|uniref:uncharacterized protein LOC113305796 n=1 Tax=Papaver somniferum TaxID=3469 RepID=UPI000E6FD134|nr:uncharacterized protein LOC113305796 [Papaver somniferum]